ncbi:hypothetical protein DFH07DRAFT_778978 [Mycena maculata]|uniref:Uncharacterized protein n=1 Tax=Mycena maculata TaxID=230809 RepID=A0AAD7N076_9AGAR|nr:hypothetical protein DFH07DRAFT_778978 [Mycena maculata]
MPLHLSLAVLKKGLSILRESIKTCHNALLAWANSSNLAGHLTPSEDEWLDQEVNDVDEDAVIQKLKSASDYKHGLSRLDTKELVLVDRLKALAGGVAEKVKGKRKTILTLSRYLVDVDGSFTRKLLVGLATFGRETQWEETQGLVSTSITDYFAHK